MQETPVKPIQAPQKPAASDRFKPQMPLIPGVSDPITPQPAAPPKLALRWIALGALVALLAAVGGIWRHRTAAHGAADSPSAVAATPASPPSEPPVPLPDLLPSASPVTVATLEELRKPWSARQFTFVRPDTHASIPAMVVRLPGISGDRSSAYWAFSLAAPYSHCNLDYVTDLSVLASRYNYSAGHPMLVAACDGTLYDPLRMATIPSGAYVRGDIAQGPGIRPPISIRVQVKGQSLVADRIE
jgi:hypothetical protein